MYLSLHCTSAADTDFLPDKRHCALLTIFAFDKSAISFIFSIIVSVIVFFCGQDVSSFFEGSKKNSLFCNIKTFFANIERRQFYRFKVPVKQYFPKTNEIQKKIVTYNKIPFIKLTIIFMKHGVSFLCIKRQVGAFFDIKTFGDRSLRKKKFELFFSILIFWRWVCSTMLRIISIFLLWAKTKKGTNGRKNKRSFLTSTQWKTHEQPLEIH